MRSTTMNTVNKPSSKQTLCDFLWDLWDLWIELENTWICQVYNLSFLVLFTGFTSEGAAIFSPIVLSNQNKKECSTLRLFGHLLPNGYLLDNFTMPVPSLSGKPALSQYLWRKHIFHILRNLKWVELSGSWGFEPRIKLKKMKKVLDIWHQTLL